jgi:hypothetical protein
MSRRPDIHRANIPQNGAVSISRANLLDASSSWKASHARRLPALHVEPGIAVNLKVDSEERAGWFASTPHELIHVMHRADPTQAAPNAAPRSDARSHDALSSRPKASPPTSAPGSRIHSEASVPSRYVRASTGHVTTVHHRRRGSPPRPSKASRVRHQGARRILTFPRGTPARTNPHQ